MLNQINAIYKNISTGELSVFRDNSGKNAGYSKELKLKIAQAVKGGLSQKEASVKFNVSESVVSTVIKSHKNRAGE